MVHRRKRKTKRKASAFALRVGKFRRSGHSFKTSVRLAKGGTSTPRRRKRKAFKVRTRSVSMVRRRRSSRRRSSSFGIPSTNKLLKIAVFSIGASIIGAQFLPGVDPKIRAAAGGFFAGGPIGAAIGYIAEPTLSGLIGGAGIGQTGVGAFV